MNEQDDVFSSNGADIPIAAARLLSRVMHTMASAAPLVHCMTNEVVTNVTANVLLSCGASPLMVVDNEECRTIAAQADGLLINVGTFSSARADAMWQAAEVRHKRCRPWVFDPVAVGGLSPRSAWAAQLIASSPPTLVRGNASEVMALAGGEGGHGTDSTSNPGEAVASAKLLLARGVKAVAISGEVDVVVAPEGVLRVHHGHPWLTRITGAGCVLGALMAAVAGLPDVTPGEAALVATLWFTLAAEKAAYRSQGPGSMMPALLDELYMLAQGMAWAEPLRVDALCENKAVCSTCAPTACPPRPAIAMTIAGTDPTGGAGLQADLSTFRALGVFGASVITAVVAQNTLGVSDMMPLSPAMVKAQMASVFEDLDVDALKVGMLGQADLIDAVADALVAHGRGGLPPCDVVLDPVMVSTSGHALLAPEAEGLLWQRLVPLASLITPNLAEAEALLGYDISPTLEGLEGAACVLQQRGARQVLLKGGHLSGHEATDIFIDAASRIHHLVSPRVNTLNTHGTGCVLSSAITALRAQGHDWLEAITLAKRFLQEALQAGQSDRFTLGNGPCLIHLPRLLRP